MHEASGGFLLMSTLHIGAVVPRRTHDCPVVMTLAAIKKETANGFVRVQTRFVRTKIGIIFNFSKLKQWCQPLIKQANYPYLKIGNKRSLNNNNNNTSHFIIIRLVVLSCAKLACTPVH